jgi:RNA methyltransferase, TrmH family
MPITSPHNESLKEVRKLAGRKWRDKTRSFVAEGEDLIDAAAAAGWTPELLLCEAGSGLAGEEVAPHLLKQVSQLGSGTRALAVYPQRWAPAPAGPVCVALWGVNDPGNVGAVLRSALAFGAGSVALGPGTADPYGSKAVRASMGAIFDVPVVRVASVAELPGHTVALAARAGRPLQELELEEVALVVGAEREGLPADVAEACDEAAHIPIASESLNAAMAATIGLYEVTRVARA